MGELTALPHTSGKAPPPLVSSTLIVSRTPPSPDQPTGLSKASGPVVLAFFVLGLCATEKSRSSNCVLNGASSVRGIPRIYGVYPVNLFSIY